MLRSHLCHWLPPKNLALLDFENDDDSRRQLSEKATYDIGTL